MGPGLNEKKNEFIIMLHVLRAMQIDQTKSILLDILDSARHEETLRTVGNYILRLKDYRYGGLRLMMLFRVNGRNFVMVRHFRMVVLKAYAI